MKGAAFAHRQYLNERVFLWEKCSGKKENVENGCGPENAENMDMQSDEHPNTADRQEMQLIALESLAYIKK
jgi:hypothetical protein